MLSRYITITHRIDDFLFELFPGTESDTEKLTDAIKRYYTVGPFEPSVEVDPDYPNALFAFAINFKQIDP